MKKILVAVAVFTLLVISCPNDDGYTPKGGEIVLPPPVKEKKFWARDMTKPLMDSNYFYQVDAQWLAYNSHCEIWVEKGASVTEAQAKAVANEYKDKIYKRVMDALRWTARYGLSVIDTMQYADILGDNNGRLIILLLDIKDGYVPGGGFVAGYFDSVNFYPDNTVSSGKTYRSNRSDMIYMDINPTVVGSEMFYATIAHEMQHLMNFVTSVAFRADVNTQGQINVMETWLNEGLSESAEWIYSGKVSQSRVNWYNDDTTGLIRQGSTFFTWDNYEDKDPMSVLNDYASVNIFFQWMRLQYSANIYRNIFLSDYSDYQAITESFENPPDWGEFLLRWHAANFINHASNLYGYKNDPILKKVKAKQLRTGDFSGTLHWLYSGEAVYSHSPSGTPRPANNEFILYSSLNNDVSPSNEGVNAGGTLLTYNINTSQDRMQVSAIITGQPSPAINVQASIQSRVSLLSQPYRIDAGDLMRRNGFEGSLNVTPFAKEPNLTMSAILNTDNKINRIEE